MKKVLILCLAVILTGLVCEKIRFTSIIIHHSGAYTGNYESIKAYHRQEKGWRDAAYHLILSNGSTDVPLGFLEATHRYRFFLPSVATKDIYYNLFAVHLCLVGDYDAGELPARLRPAVANAIRHLQVKYGIADRNVLFHRDCGSTSCPGSYITKDKVRQWLAAENGHCPPSIRKQQEQVLGPAWKWLPYLY